ncbi:MAG: SDR family oxidoreductase [Acidimicrobiia bacterium]|nr:SDR family oxidoreductase [Acidimicrobiia bacterium]MDH5236683.1 SDR family oxidoreductase [Acidimicrobiia bacterium]
MHRFEGRVALITGAASGIGQATAVRLASEGATIAALDRDETGLATTAELVAATGATLQLVACDIGDEQAVGRAVANVVDAHQRIDTLINLAGILRSCHSHEVTLEEWNEVITVNLTGTFLMTREALPHLLERRGNIVMAASTSALAGHPWMLPYAASKGAILAMTHTLAVEYARRGLRVNAVAPGGITTPMAANVRLPEDADFSLLDRISPVDEFRGPETVAATIAFLASDDAAHVNGEVVRVDGATLA